MKKFIVMSLILFISSLVFFGFFYQLSLKTIPEVNSLETFKLSSGTKIYDRTGKVLLFDFTPKKQKSLSFEEIPESVVQAFLAAEDLNFYHHFGVDFLGIFRALLKNIKARKFVQGGSTITQQLAKFFLNKKEKTLFRKVQDMILAIDLEKKFSKKELLAFYLNYIYLGRGYYGVAAASEGYFHKSVQELNPAEAALLAGLLVAPSKYAPHLNSKSSKTRQSYVLSQMLQANFLTQEKYDQAVKEIIKIYPAQKTTFHGGHFTDYVRLKLIEQYGQIFLEENPWIILTTMDYKLQQKAEEVIEEQIINLSETSFVQETPILDVNKFLQDQFNFLLKNTQPFYLLDSGEKKFIQESSLLKNNSTYEAIVKKIQDKKMIVQIAKEKREINFSQNIHQKFNVNQKILVKIVNNEIAKYVAKDHYEGALVSMHVPTGHILSMVGSKDFFESPFNRAVQAKRQLGSSFKPFIYLCATREGFTNNTILWDLPQSLDTDQEDVLWKPKNVDKNFKGKMTFRQALEESRNIPTLKILESLGLNTMNKCLKDLGFKNLKADNLGFALGNFELSLLELVESFTLFPSLGLKISSQFLLSINNEEISIYEPQRVIAEDKAFLTLSLLQGAVLRGTAKRAQALGPFVGGKTGTTNNNQDAWFIGFTQNILTGTWFGEDKNNPLPVGSGGARTAIPPWLKYMKEAIKYYPIAKYEVPESITTQLLEYETGKPYKNQGTPLTEYFLQGTENLAKDLDTSLDLQDEYYDLVQ